MKKILKTKRLFLRELSLSDKYNLSKILSDPETMKYYPHPFSLNEVENWIKWNLDNYKNFNHGLWAVILKKNKTFLGDCGITIQEIENKKIPELGYHIKKEYWNQGYATEAANACKNYAFNFLKISNLYIYTTPDNIPSQKVAEKIGMKFIKTFYKTISGSKQIQVLYSIKIN